MRNINMEINAYPDLERFRELNWGLRTWDQWSFNDCDKRFGDEWPGRIPAQLIAHILQKKKTLGVTSRYVIISKLVMQKGD